MDRFPNEPMIPTTDIKLSNCICWTPLDGTFIQASFTEPEKLIRVVDFSRKMIGDRIIRLLILCVENLNMCRFVMDIV